MKYFTLTIILSTLFIACNSQTKDEPIKEIKAYTIEQFYANTQISGCSFSHDETKLLISSNVTGIHNVYAQHIDGSQLDTLTQSEKESFWALSFFPNDDRVIFTADQGGNEINHIYLREINGDIKDLTPDAEAKASFNGWSKDEKSFYYTSNKRDPRFFDLYEMDIASFKSTLLYENKEGYNLNDISDNKQFIVLSQSITNSINDLFVYDRNKKALTKINGAIESSNDAQGFSLDNKFLYFTTDEGSEFAYLKKYDLENKTSEKVFETKWDVIYASHSFNETYRVIGINEDAKTAIKITNLKTGKDVKLPEIKGGDITSVNISKSEKLMRLTVGSSSKPSDIYVYNFETEELKKLTNSLNPEINPEDLVDGEVIRFKSFDGLEIPSLLYKPKTAAANNKVPVMLMIHGGPGGQSRLNYFPLIQYLVNSGYGIIAVNNRGSSGYGKTFFRADDKKHGEDDLMDCIKSKDYLATLDWVDTSKIGIMGGSYGGYMVMAALAFQPDAFKVGVNIFGVTNWLRTLRSIPSYWEAQRKALYEELGNPDTQDSVRLRQISPLFHAKNVTKPLMVLQGANDPRVLQVESDEIVAAVKANNVPVEYVLFPDEGHGFRKKENEIKGYGDIKIFLDKHLKGI